MPEAISTEAPKFGEILSPAVLADVQKRGSAAFSETNDLMLKTARALWEGQTEFFRIEADGAAKALTPLHLNGNPAAALSAFIEQQHGQADRLLTSFRKTSDVLNNFGWELLGICARNCQAPATPAPRQK